MFLELKRAMNPLTTATKLPPCGVRSCRSITAALGSKPLIPISRTSRTRISRSAVCLQFLYRLKDLPDATYPGVLRELLALDFPMVVSTKAGVPDQAGRLKHLRGAAAANVRPRQRDTRGGFPVSTSMRRLRRGNW